ncbi:MAG: DHHA1 domain-containing protein, partial [Chloroflexota bacterium]|nr:DHHA1 domain-containing protein [Chloroflexota bacterium]
DAGIQTIITDHHSPSERLPNAVALVNPALQDSNYPFDGLTGVGTAFKVIEALFQTYEKSIPEYLYALVALGTISDVGRMRDENRYLARKGIAVMKSLQMPGIDSLIRKAGFSKNRISSENLSFGIIPRINVAGRLEHADLSLRLLMSTDSEESAAIANKLEYLNKKRQVITEKAVSEARNQLIRNNPEKIPSMIFSGNKTWPAGILGLVAGRLSEEYHRPVIAVSGVGEYLRASARSIPEFNMIEALRTCESVFEKYGGHPMAAGFTIHKDNLREFRQQMSSIADELLGQLCVGSVLEIEYEITPGWLNSESLKFLSDLEPYGDGNATPVFMTTGVNVLDARAVGKERDHLKLTVEHKGNLFDAIAFRQGNRLKEARGDLDIAYTGGVNYWKGRESVQLTVQDFRKSNQASGSF